jgi:ribosomal protein L13
MTSPAPVVGRRKEAIVRVRLIPGTGEFKLNGRTMDNYFPNKVHQQLIREPFVTLEKVAVTGAKLGEYRYRHSGYPGGLSKKTVGELLETKPERVIELAVKGMLPKSKLGKAMAKKLKVYADDEGLTRHAAQKPEPLALSPRAAAQKA